MGPRGRLRPWGVWGCGDTSGLTRPHRAASLSALLELIVHAGGQQLRAVGGAAVGMGGSSSTAVGALQGQWEPPAQGTYLPPCEGPARPRAAPGPAQLCKAPAPELSPRAQPYGVLSGWGFTPSPFSARVPPAQWAAAAPPEVQQSLLPLHAPRAVSIYICRRQICNNVLICNTSGNSHPGDIRRQ